MWKELKFKLTGDGPLLMKNGQTADPLNKFVKASKEISGKRKKTDEDQLELRRLDFLGALYVGEAGPCIPSDLITATLIAGAKKERNGPAAKAGVYSNGNFNLEYEGSRVPDELYLTHCDVRPVRVGQAKVMRARPIFHQWTTVVTVNYEDTLCNAADVERWLGIAGQQCGIGDYRPRYGRFFVEKV